MLNNKKNVLIIDGETIESFFEKLDYSLTTNEERVCFVNALFEKPNFFTKYYSYSFHTPQDDATVSRALDIVSDYMMAGISDYITAKQMNKSKKYEVSLDSVQELDIGVYKGNFYKEVKQKIFARDFKDPELAPYLNDYQRYKIYLQKTRDKAKVAKNGKLKYRCDKIIGDINQSMIEVKNAIKRPIRFKSVSQTKSEINWLECDYCNLEHVRALLSVSSKRLINDLGVLTYDITLMLKKIILTKTERKIINFIRNNDNLTQSEVAAELKCTQPFINATLKSVTKKIVEYNISLSN